MSIIDDKGVSMTPQQVEALFCLAVVAEGSEVTARVLGRFLEYCKHKDEVLAKINERWASEGRKDGDHGC